MRKQQKKLLAQFIFIIGVIVLIAYLSQNGLPFAVSVPSDCSEVQVSDIEEVDMAYNDDLFTNAIHIKARPGGGGDCVEIAWDKDDLDDVLRKGGSDTEDYSATKDLDNFYMTLDEYKISYGISQEDTTGEEYESTSRLKSNSFCGYICSVDNCEDELGSLGYREDYIIADWDDGGGCGYTTDRCNCYYNKPGFAQKGKFSSQSDIFRKVTFGVEGLGKETDVSGEGQLPSGEIGDKVIIEWFGDVSGGIDYDRPSDGYLPTRTIEDQSGEWYFNREVEWNSLGTTLDLLKSSLHDCQSGIYGYYSNDDCIERAISNFELDRNYFRMVEPQAVDEFLDENPGLKDINMKEDEIVLIADEPETLPVFDIYLDAEWAGIRKLVTDPRCQFIQNSIQVETGKTKNIGLNVYNDADFPGSINAQVDCSNSISASVSPNQYDFDGKGSRSGTVSIGGEAIQQDIYGNCEVTVTDSNKPSNLDTCSIDVQVKKISCTPGDKECSADFEKLLTCGSNGQWFETDCEYGCSNEGIPHCVEVDPDCPDTCSEDSDCSECGDGEWICDESSCKKLSPGMECESCFGWLWNKASPGYCEPTQPSYWYLPEAVESQFGQDTLCPVILIFFGLFLVVGIIIAILILKLIIDLINKSKRRTRRR